MISLSLTSTTAEGFASIRYGAKYTNEQKCVNSTVVTTTNFICDADAKFSPSQPDITQYLASIERIAEAECFVSVPGSINILDTLSFFLHIHTIS